MFVSFGDFGPLKTSLSLCGVLNFRLFFVVVVSSKGRTLSCASVCVSIGIIPKEGERERERPQKRDRVVVQGITALKTTPTLNVRALERERCFERRRFQSFWTTRFSYFSKRYTGHACRFAFKFFLSFWIENLI